MKNKTFRWLRRAVALLLCLCLACAGLTGIALAVETEPETPPEETLEEGPTEPAEEPVEEPETPITEPEYQVQVDDISGYYNEPVGLTIRVEDVGGTGWQKVEASLFPDDPEQHTDLTEELLLNGAATYTVSENCTMYFFITDLEGVEYTDALHALGSLDRYFFWCRDGCKAQRRTERHNGIHRRGQSGCACDHRTGRGLHRKRQRCDQGLAL